ncbi:hypothetical protein [Bartonella sp. CL45QHWL]|uniref:hypothetical protein n=1 Tax=Bartonella sp. CL45QHWL TaxID=3243533 RepID=UPI0035CECEAD
MVLRGQSFRCCAEGVPWGMTRWGVPWGMTRWGVPWGMTRWGVPWVVRGVMALRVAVGVSKGFCIKIY